jgi:hypothetical protein
MLNTAGHDLMLTYSGYVAEEGSSGSNGNRQQYGARTEAERDNHWLVCLQDIEPATTGSGSACGLTSTELECWGLTPQVYPS